MLFKGKEMIQLFTTSSNSSFMNICIHIIQNYLISEMEPGFTSICKVILPAKGSQSSDHLSRNT